MRVCVGTVLPFIASGIDADADGVCLST